MQKVASPDLIRACPMSGNIAVLDQDEHAHGGLGRPHITVLTGTLGMLFQYYGSRVTQGNVFIVSFQIFYKLINLHWNFTFTMTKTSFM